LLNRLEILFKDRKQLFCKNSKCITICYIYYIIFFPKSMINFRPIKTIFVGFYQVIFREAQHPDVAISTSNVMSVTWGDYYKLSSVQKSIFPCDGQLVVNYTRPKCVRRADNVHMFARISRSMAPVSHSSLM